MPRAKWITAAAVGLILLSGACTDPPAVRRRPVLNAATSLRAKTFALLGEHVHLAAAITSHERAGEADAARFARAALDATANDLISAIDSVYADPAFGSLWRRHVDTLVEGTGSAITGELATLLERLTEGRLGRDDVTVILDDHVGTLRAATDALAGARFIEGYQHLRTAYTHMTKLSEAIATAIASQRPDVVANQPPDTPAGGLQVILTRLLGEHTNLIAAAATHALVPNARALDGAGRALDGNASDLAGALGLIYGDAAADAFMAAWRDHAALYITYMRATVVGDRARMDRAVAGLTASAKQLAEHLTDLTDGRARTETLSGLMTTHVLGLKDVIDALEAGDFGKAYAAQRAAYAHARMIGDALVSAIADQFPNKYDESSDGD